MSTPRAAAAIWPKCGAPERGPGHGPERTSTTAGIGIGPRMPSQGRGRTMTETRDITEWLVRWRAGERGGEAELIRRIYPVVRAIAHQQIGRVGAGLTLQATEVAHDALIELARKRGVVLNDRRHLFGVVAKIIRCSLIDYLRERSALKRGGDVDRVSLSDIDDDEQPSSEANLDWLALDQALVELHELEPQQAELVELRYFAGLSIEDAADALDLSRSTAVRAWRFARAWLADRIGAP
jgi:RNA polymerase sigma factor (TIGR02999 family)